MSSGATASPYGFVGVRGRGYRPEQVDAYASGLSRERDDAWERAARLTVLAKEMEAELGRLREAVAGLAPQTYEELGARAQQILAVSEAEAAELRAGAETEARRVGDESDAAAQEVAATARAYADDLRAEAEERARQRLLAARATADDARIAARRDVKERRGEALAALRDMRQRSATLLADQEKEHAERREAVEREIAAAVTAADAREAQQVAAAEARLSEGKRAFAEAEESARHGQEDAEARGAELVAEAVVKEERITRETERLLREHGEEWDEVRAHMDHVRTSLTALTGRAPAEETP
ncbi:cellulose-binding protein [Streptomyces sp. NPDC050658]|uniref:cellulose-binding protein n=1 Tax=unclassified Streptomyces TaxID=2593676 RepID=UPI00341BE68F